MKTAMASVVGCLVASAAMATAELPDYLKAEAVIWLDANVNVVTDGSGGVTEWRDAREAGTSATAQHPRALAYNPTPANDYSAVLPTMYDDSEGKFSGKTLVDFGEFTSGKWLYFARPDNVITQLPACAFLGVVGFHGRSSGTFLGDTTSISSGPGGKIFFLKQTSSLADTCIARSTSLHVQGGTRIDGEAIDPTVTKYRDFQVFSQNGPRFFDNAGAYIRPYVSTLFNESNYKVVNGTSSDRQGGGILGELLIFGRPLADSERRAVEEYLSQKWFGKPCGSAMAAEEAVERLDPSTIADGTVYVTNGVSILSPAPAAGAPAIDGYPPAAENLAADFGTVRSEYDVEGNSVVTVTKNFTVPRDGIYRFSATIARDPEGEETEGNLTAQFGLDGNAVIYNYCIQTDARGGIDVAKTYTFTFPYMSAGEHRLRFSMAKGTNKAKRAYTASDIQITLVKAGEFVPVNDAGFDSVFNPINTDGSRFLKAPGQGVLWTFTQQKASISCGLTQDSTYWYWKGGFAGDELADMRKAFIDYGSVISQRVVVARSGRARLSFRYANRSNSGAGPRATGHWVSVSLGGTEIATAYPATQQNRTCTADFDIQAGAQDLAFTVVRPDDGTSYTAIIDDVMIEYIDNEVAPSASVDKAVAADAAGWYRLVVDAAGPSVDRNSGTNCLSANVTCSPVSAAVSLNGVAVGTMTVASDDFASYAFTLPRLAAGGYTATVSNTGPLGLRVRNVSLSAVDGAELSPLTDETVSNTTFVVASPGKLHLDFAGTLSGCRMKLEGRKRAGTFSAETDAVHFLGEGVVESVIPGVVIIIQ